MRLAATLVVFGLFGPGVTQWTFTSLSAQAAEIPHIADRTPSRGPVTGGTHLFLIGSGFSGATAVKFKAQAGDAGLVRVACPSADCSVDSESQISVVAPAFTVASQQGGPGIVDLIVVGTAGESAVVASDTFTFTPMVQIVSQNSWDVTTQLPPTVTVTGSGFAWKDSSGTSHGLTASNVCFGQTPTGACNSPISITSTDPERQFTAIPPVHTAGTVDVEVITNSVPSPDNAALDDFNYGSGPPAGHHQQSVQ